MCFEQTVGVGRHKIVEANSESPETVEIRYHEEGVAVDRDKRVVFAQFYQQKILHILFPKNFPDVSFANKEKMIVRRVPDTENLLRAREIERNFRLRSEEYGMPFRSYEESIWIHEAQEEMLSNDKFIELMSDLEEILESSPDRSKAELATPSNSTIVNGEPVIIELFDAVDAILLDAGSTNRPSIKEHGLSKFLERGLYEGRYSEKDVKRLLRLHKRYRRHVNSII